MFSGLKNIEIIPERCVAIGCNNVREPGRVALFKWPKNLACARHWTSFVSLSRYVTDVDVYSLGILGSSNSFVSKFQIFIKLPYLNG